jgi:NADH-quinone oxidoreductase subunit N
MQLNFILFFQEYVLILGPEISLSLTILFIALYAVFSATKKSKPLIMEATNWLAIVGIGIIIVVFENTNYSTSNVYSSIFLFTTHTKIIKLIILIFTAICIILCKNILSHLKINQFEYVMLTLTATLGLLFLTSSNHFMTLYLSLEMQSLCLFALACSKRDSSMSSEAGLKYFVLGALSSALLLYGISQIYGVTGHLDFDSIKLSAAHLPTHSAQFKNLCAGQLFIISALFFKLSVAPFHVWSPDVYEGSPISATLYFAVVPKLPVFSVLFYLGFVVFSSYSELYTHAAFYGACISMFIGSFGALFQKKLKRLLAFSSVSHMSFVLMAFSIHTKEALTLAFLYLFIYMITTVLLWTLIASLRFENDDNRSRSKTVLDLVVASKNSSLIRFSGLIALFSLCGLPPLAGFMGKALIFKEVMSHEAYIMAGIIILTSVISSVYYLGLIKNLY